MKGFIYFLSIIAFVVNANREDFKKYLSAYLKEIGGDGNAEELDHCIREPDIVLEYTELAMNYVRDMTDNGLREGVAYFKETTEELVAMFYPCTDNQHVIRKLGHAVFKATKDQIIEKFNNKTGQYFHLATSAYAAFKEKKFDEAGTNVGGMISLTFFDADLGPTPYWLGNSMQIFITGFAKTIEEQKNLDNLLKCAKEDEEIFKAFNESLYLIRTINAVDMLSGSKILLTVTKKFMKMLTPCLNDYETFKNLDGKLKYADPKGMVKIMSRAISTFFHLSNDAVEGFGQRKYDNVGKAIGAMQKNLFLK